MRFGLIKDDILFLGTGEYFGGIFGSATVWKDVGWNTIVYLAAMTMVDPSQYEAAEIDSGWDLLITTDVYF